MAAYSLLVDTYRDICGGAAAFSAACVRALPMTAWRADVASHSGTDPGADSGPHVPGYAVPIPWRTGAYRISTDSAPVDFMAHYLLGRWHIQEEAALLAVHLLAPSPGDHVLDMCAAPGNKTAELALAVGPEGAVIAADRSRARLGVVQTTMNRLGLTNVTRLVADGGDFPAPDNTFDLVLVDAPCSAEGTCRRHPDILHDAERLGRANHSTLRGAQVRLLREAARLVRPGGRIAYATCTFSPEENEGVVSDVLGARGGRPVGLRVALPRDIAGLVLRPGLPSWQGERFHADVRHARRLWPHDNDTGGFFVCILEKEDAGSQGTGGRAGRGSAGGSIRAGSALDANALPWSILGLDSADLARWRMVRGRLVSPGLAWRATLDPAAAHTTGVSSGLRLFNPKTSDSRLTTEAARVVGPFAQNGTVEIAPDQLVDYLLGREIEPRGVSPAAPHIPVVIVRCQGAALGLGRMQADGLLESLFPRTWGGVDVQRSLNRNDITPV